MDAQPSNGMTKTFEYNSSISQKPPLFTTMETSHHYRSSFTQNSSSNLIDVSFSSYLRPKSSASASASQECSVDECELSIFDAKKYFNESIHDPKDNNNKAPSSSSAVNKGYEPPPPTPPSVPPRLSSFSSSGDGYSRNYRVRSFNATPTASSEASWNSQTGLLSNPPGSIAVSLRNVPNPHRNQDRKRGPPKWFFGRSCPCTGKKSVQVQDQDQDQDVLPLGPESILHSKRHIPKSDKRMADTNSHKKSSVTTANDLELEEIPKPNSHRSTQIPKSKFQVPDEKLVVVIPNSKFTQEEKLVVIPKNSHSQSHRLISSSEPPPNFASSNIVHHQGVLGPGRTHGNGSTSAGGFSFPILNPSCPAKKGLLLPSTISQTQLDDPPRKSLEVFQPTDESVSRKSINRRFSESPISRTEDDVASDASSDLFEIDSFSTQTTSYPMYHRRDSLDEAPTFNARRLAAAATLYGGGRRSLDEPMTPSIVPTECYEPSEASIDWSVTTAEGYDRACVTNFFISASEIDYVAPITTRGGWDNGGGGMEEGLKRRGNGLLSCRHEKAVSVGPNPVKCVQEEEEQPGGPPYPLISTFRHVSSRPPQPNNHPNKPHLASSNSARLSLGFAT